MEANREMSKLVCVALLEILQTQHSAATIDSIAVDVAKLRSWLASNPGITDAAGLDSAMGYNNFCLDVVTATRSSQYS